jgi:hypothetical protein
MVSPREDEREQDSGAATSDKSLARPAAPWRIDTSRSRSLSPGSTGATLSAVDTVLATPSTTASSPPAGRGEVGELSELGELGEAEADADADAAAAGDREGEDTVRELGRPLRSAGASGRGPSKNRAPAPALEPEIVEEVENASEDEREGVDHLDAPMYAGSSPPRKAPIGSQPVELGRKGTKWRRSMIGMSDVSVACGRRGEGATGAARAVLAVCH